MLEYLYLARWDQAYDVLAAGNPPMFLRLLLLNALFLGLYAVRRASGARAMSSGSTLLVQLAVLAANLLLLYQSQVQDYLRSLTIGS